MRAIAPARLPEPEPARAAVDAEGRAYISHFGFDWFAGEELRETGLIVREPDGRVALQGGGLGFPNGVVLSPDGRRLYVSESFSSPVTRLSALTDRVSMGELDAPEFSVRSKDEIGVLSDSFARMRKSLVHAMKLLDA